MKPKLFLNFQLIENKHYFEIQEKLCTIRHFNIARSEIESDREWVLFI